MNTRTTIIATRSKMLAESLARAIAAVSHRAVNVVPNDQRNWFELELSNSQPLPGEVKALRGVAKNLVMLARLRRKSRERDDVLLANAKYVLEEWAGGSWSCIDGPTPDLQQLLDVRPSRRSKCQIMQVLDDGRNRVLYRSKENGWDILYPEQPFTRKGWQQDMQDVENMMVSRSEQHERKVTSTRAGLRSAAAALAKRGTTRMSRREKEDIACEYNARHG